MGTKVAEDTILWRRLDRPGHESARLSVEGSSRCLEGTAVFDHEGAPCRLDYDIVCDSGFETLRGSVAGWVGERSIRIEIGVEEGEWWLDGSECPAVQGAVDLDLNFSPSTNLLPIRRLNLEVGQEAAVLAAWLRFPGFDLVPLEQTYRRLGVSMYRYESAGGFMREIAVRRSGLVTLYPDFWQAEGSG